MEKVIKITNIIPAGQKHYDRRNEVIWPKGSCHSLVAAMGVGGGFVPLILILQKYGQTDSNSQLYSRQEELQQSAGRPHLLRERPVPDAHLRDTAEFDDHNSKEK